jgi:uncharacterized protein
MKEGINILSRVKEIVLRQEPDAKIYLYGSRARGIYQPDSDWDLLILLNKEKITLDIENKITNPLYELELETGEVVSPNIYSEKEWNSKYWVTPLYTNVMKEGKLL